MNIVFDDGRVRKILLLLLKYSEGNFLQTVGANTLHTEKFRFMDKKVLEISRFFVAP